MEIVQIVGNRQESARVGGVVGKEACLLFGRCRTQLAVMLIAQGAHPRASWSGSGKHYPGHAETYGHLFPELEA